MDPLRHFIESGLRERRDPNRWFDSAWYARQYPDVAASGAHPLLHYMSEGAARGRDPHPRFDAGWYVEQHPEAANNPLLFHLRVGASRGWLTERPVAIEDYLPSSDAPFETPAGITVDIVIPVYRGLEVTRRCLESVLEDPDRPAGSIIVIDDCSPDPKLTSLVNRLAKASGMTVLRNKKNLGFVASVNRGMRHAGRNDVVLLNSDTEVPHGWLRRLQAQAYATDNVASVSPLSNNASICSYLDYEGGPIPLGMTLPGIDEACQTVNAGRSAPAPTAVGFCMYIRRAALDQVGGFDAKTFGKGYGEENDFCLRASAFGWVHHIACDTFVAHAGGASFGASADAGITRAYTILTARYPEYPALVAYHVDDARTAPFRFAITMWLFRTSGLPTILLISHDLDGGVRRHARDVVERDAGKANYLMLEPASRGLALSVPALPGHPKIVLAAERWRDVAAVARSAGVTRVHIHHLMGLDLDVRALIHDLGVPFDVTVHDYFAICPQVTLLPWSAGAYCGEPGPEGCDACIANRPSHGATDILSWRLRWAWQFREAEHVYAPSQDALDRIARYGAGANATLAPHEPVVREQAVMPPRPSKRLRVAVLGVLADHKGAHVVASLAMESDPVALDIHLIGYTEETFPAAARERMTITGPYREGELPALLAKVRPHVIWFPAPWPETYSYTLSAAIASGLPIVATEIGAFPERLSGRDLTWLIPPTADPAVWRDLFEIVATTLRARTTSGRGHAGRASLERASGNSAKSEHVSVERARSRSTGSRPTSFGSTSSGSANLAFAIPWEVVSAGARPPNAGQAQAIRATRSARRSGTTPPLNSPPTRDLTAGLIDVRRNGTTAVLAIPDSYDDGSFTPCGYIRLLLPLDHPAAGQGLTTTIADAGAALRYHADIIVTQRHAVPSIAAAEALAAHAKRTGAALIYDFDDDLLNISPDHPEAADLLPKAGVVARMIGLADIVRTSTATLASRVAPLARRVEVTGNGLDERIWLSSMRGATNDYRPVGILCMGTATHDADFAIILPALTEIHRQFGEHVQFSLLGFVATADVPDWIQVIGPSPHASRSYPGFVNWLTTGGRWDIGLAPLADTPFNAAKSSIKTLDYAALGLATLASGVAAYRGSLADGLGGRLVANTDMAWYDALSHLIRDAPARRSLAHGGAKALLETGTLAAQADAWRKAWPRIGARGRKAIN